ncbi:hypothetical protein [Thermobifida alba]|uniref:hypothetical protein n=1 Tax=Thermobifida alba TaxID=53522 RepID=UPI0020BEAE71|nr:hypothetical protein [Thermobifida alba]
MRQPLQTAGFLLMLMGLSGAVDHLYVQPFMGAFLNVFNRVVIPRIDLLTGYELYANLSLAVLGFVVMVAGGRIPE